VTDVDLRTARRDLSINVTTATFAVTTTALPAATRGTAYEAQLNSAGGTAPITWAVVTGALPAGLSLNRNSGAITGTPATSGSFSFTVEATDAETRTARKDLSIGVTSPAFAITTTSLAAATRGTAYTAQVNSTGGTTPVTWAIVSGALPAGLSLNRASGLISGTPAATGSFAFTIEATDGEARSARRELSITVTAPPLFIELVPAVEALKGTAFSYQIGASGGVAPYTWSVTSGALPAGLSLNAATGTLSGTATEAGTFNVGITLRDAAAQSASGTIRIRVIDPATVPAIITAKYKSSKRKLTVTGERIVATATMLIDGVPVTGNVYDGLIVVKKLDLSVGRHELRIVNPDDVRSAVFVVTVE
jgi:hypothetical protein